MSKTDIIKTYIFEPNYYEYKKTKLLFFIKNI